jgi:hypothetical protein
VEDQPILVLVQIVEANGTLQPTLDPGKSDGADRAVVVTTSRWQGLLVFLLGCLLLGRLLPPESEKPSIQGFIVAKIPINLVLQLYNPLFKHVNLNIYEWLHLVIKIEMIKNRSMT